MLTACHVCPFSLVKKAEERIKFGDCIASIKRFDLGTPELLPKRCLLFVDKGISRTDAYRSDHEEAPLMLTENRLVPAVPKEGRYVIPCSVDEGYIDECDAGNDEDCRDCWHKPYDRKDKE